MSYIEMNETQLKEELSCVLQQYNHYKAKNLKLNMARGKPAPAQLDLSSNMLTMQLTESDYVLEDGTDCRNYGIIEGTPDARSLMAELLNDKPENVLVLGNSSLTIEHDLLSMLLDFGTGESSPWYEQSTVKWLCPVPGYDRHFAMCQEYGIEMVPVPMNFDGPDMDTVEHLVKDDSSIKGIWCVPQYSNPTGAIYSDEVVNRLATMECAASDFKIFWDNAYCVHHFFEDDIVEVSDIAQACISAGHNNRYYKFCSTSKIAFPGAGIAAVAASSANILEFKKYLEYKMLCGDKLNMVRTTKFLSDKNAVLAHMKKHADLLVPKFLAVQEELSELRELGIAEWTNPNGGYFVSFDGLPFTAARSVELAKEAGVILTNAGATWPYGKDPLDSNIRIAPTYPTLDELNLALKVFVCCVKIAAIESLLQ